MVRCDIPTLDPDRRQSDGARGQSNDLRPRLNDRRRPEAVFAEDVPQTFDRSLRVTADHHGAANVMMLLDRIEDEIDHMAIVGLAALRKVLSMPSAGLDGANGDGGRIRPRCHETGKLQHPAIRQVSVHIGRGQIKPFGRKRLIGGAALRHMGLVKQSSARCKVFGDGLEPLCHRRIDLLVDGDQGVLGEIVEQRRHRRLEERQPVFHPTKTAPGADRLVKGIILCRPELLPVPGTKPRDGPLGQG